MRHADRADELVARSRAKVAQKRHERESSLRGTRGRAEHKAKARSTNKPSGGKMAR